MSSETDWLLCKLSVVRGRQAEAKFEISIELSRRAHRDHRETIGHDQYQEVGNDQHNIVKHDQKEEIGNDRTETIGNNVSEAVGKRLNPQSYVV